MKDLMFRYTYTSSLIKTNDYDNKTIAYCRLGYAVIRDLYRDYKKDRIDEKYLKECFNDNLWLNLLGVDEEYVYNKFISNKMVYVMNKLLKRR